MKQVTIHGGVPLRGEMTVPGAKNAATKELVACLLTDEPVRLENVPDIGDVRTTIEMLASLGAAASFHNGVVTVDAGRMASPVVKEAQHRKNRIPILLLGPLLHRFGSATIPALGGCKIGARPVNFHLDALEKMGVTITCTDTGYIAEAKKITGAVIDLPFPSVGATENIMLTAVLAEGTTTIRNAAVEPEIVDLASLLQAMGAVINLDANRTWVIEGVSSLHGAAHRVLPDRMVAASFMTAAALSGGDVTVRDARQSDLMAFLNALRKADIPFEILEGGIRVSAPKKIKPIVLETDVHPGFMTDWQQPFVIALTQADGVSIVHETVYEDRFGYTEALRSMGANIQLHCECLGGKTCRFAGMDYRHSAVIVGPTPLQGAKIEIPDLRAGFSYIIAALIAEGTSVMTGVEHIERGYEDVIGRLASLGARIDVEGGT